MGKMGMGKMGKMGKMGMMGGMMGGMGGGGKVPVAPVDPVVDPVVDEEAAAVGDPHLSLNTGEKKDLCCTAGICKPCSSVSLISHKTNIEEKLHEGLLEARAEVALEAAQGPRQRGMMMGGMMGMMGGKMGMMGGMMGGMGGGGKVPVAPVDPDDEAAAVGDPHMSLNIGSEEDLCCTGGVCEPCSSVSLISHKTDTEEKLHR